MSVIVFDGQTLAADSHINNGSTSFAMNKIIEVPANLVQGTPRTLVGAVGNAQYVAAALNLMAQGESINKIFSTPDLYFNGHFTLVTVTKEQGLIRYNGNAIPHLHGFNKIAIGDGAPFAYGAMGALEDIGYIPPYGLVRSAAALAVNQAIKHSLHCNGEPVTLTL